jgi:type IV pilus assembly protein PilV
MRPRTSQNGFSLIEVMVALIVVSVGLLGVAKMQALALSSTTSARTRSLVALEAASLASTMRADRNYWSTVTADPNVTFSNGAITAGDGALKAASGPCPCTPQQIAYGDLNDWLKDLGLQVASPQGSISCTPLPVAAVPTAPVTCTITLQWSEKLIAANAQQAAQIKAAGGSEQITYQLSVNP